MRTLVMPAGPMGAAAPREDLACAGTCQGQTAKKPQQRFADVPSVSTMKDQPKSGAGSEKMSGHSESASRIIPNGERKRTGPLAPKGDRGETPVVAPGWLVPGSVQAVSGQPEAPPATGPSGKASSSQVAIVAASAEAGHASHLQRFRLARTSSSSQAGPTNEPRASAGKQAVKGDAGPSFRQGQDPAGQVVSGSAKPSGGADKTNASVARPYPGNQGESEQALRRTTRDGAAAEALAVRAADQGASARQKAMESRMGSLDPSGAASAPIKSGAPGQAEGAAAKEAGEAGQRSAMQAVAAREQTLEEFNRGGRQAAQPPGGKLFLEKKELGQLSANEPHLGISREERHMRPEFVIPGNEPSGPALRSVVPDHGSSDGSGPRSPVQSVGEQILDSVHASVARGDKQLLVRLQPPELGAVVIRFREQAGEIRAVMEVDRSDTRREIEHALPQVLRGLQEAGVQIKRLDVVPQEQSDRDAGRGLLQQDGSMSQQNPGHNSGQTHERFQPSWGTYWGAGRQDALSLPPDDVGSSAQAGTGQGRIDVLL